MSHQFLEYLPSYNHLSKDRWMPKQILKVYPGMQGSDQVDPENSNMTLENLLHLSCLPWWWDTRPGTAEDRKHQEMALQTDGRCCGVHYLGLPEKKGVKRPMFLYQQHAFHLMEQNKAACFWKAAGLGFTTASQYYFPLRALNCSNPAMAHSTIPILTGKNVGIAKDFIQGVRDIFKNRRGILFKGDNKNIQFPWPNDVNMRAFPSNEDVEAARGLKKVYYSYTDEVDFYTKASGRIVLDINERYVGKSGARIMLVSTPNKPGHILDLVQKHFSSQYVIWKIDWRYGYGLIYDEEDIRRAMTLGSWLREYCLQFLGGGGNVYLPSDLRWAYLIGDLAARQYPQIESIYSPIFPKCIGVDPGWAPDGSAFAVTVTAMRDGFMEVVDHYHYEAPRFNDMVKLLMELFYRYKNSKIIVDASQNSFIAELKDRLKDRKPMENMGYIDSFDTLQNLKTGMKNLGEKRMDAQEYMKYKMRMKDIFSRKVIPVDFGSMREPMLETNAMFVKRGLVRIPRRFETLCIGLEGAVTQPHTHWNLDKEETPYDDDIDSFCMSTVRFNFDVKHAKYNLDDSRNRERIYQNLLSMVPNVTA